jgi:hypothetical protein
MDCTPVARIGGYPMMIRPSLTALRMMFAMGIAMSLGACSPGDVQLNGKLFDALGGVMGTGGEQKDVRLAERPGLVTPPGLQSLPAPGAESVPDGQLASIVDHDRKSGVNKAELEKKQAEYCKVNYEQAKQRGDNTADLATGPLGSCRPSVTGLISSINGGGSK